MRCFCIVVYLSVFLWADASSWKENNSALHPSEEESVNFNQNSPEVEKVSKDSKVLNEKIGYESLTENCQHLDGHGSPATLSYPRKGKTSTSKPKPTPKINSGTGSPPKSNGTAAEAAIETERIKKQAHSSGDVRPTTLIRTKNNKDLRGTDALKQRRQLSQVKSEGWTPLSLKSNVTVPEVSMEPERIKKQSHLSMIVDPTNLIHTVSQDVEVRKLRQLSESNNGAENLQPQKTNRSSAEVTMEPERIKKQAQSLSEFHPTNWIPAEELQGTDGMKQNSQLLQDLLNTNENQYQFRSLSSKLGPQRISDNVEYFDDGRDSESKDLVNSNRQNMNQNKWEDCEDFLRGSDIEWEDEDENGEYGRPARSPQFPIEWEEPDDPEMKMAYDATYIYY